MSPEKLLHAVGSSLTTPGNQWLLQRTYISLHITPGLATVNLRPREEKSLRRMRRNGVRANPCLEGLECKAKAEFLLNPEIPFLCF